MARSAQVQTLDDVDFDPGPPSQDDVDATFNGETALAFLNTAVAGDSDKLVFDLEIAINDVRKGAGCPGAIPARLRDELLRSLVRAHLAAAESLPGWCDRERIAKGMHALAGLIVRWAEPLELRKQRDTLIGHELFAYSKMLLNDLNTMRLEQDLERHRARARESAWAGQALFG